jgi:hypothetical protein
LVGSLGLNAYLYDVPTHHELFRLTGSDTRQNDLFGRSVALNSDYALIGANQAQAAYLFDAHTGQQLQKFVDPNAPPSFGFGFGVSVATSGNLALIGDSGDDVAGNDAGAAYLFDISTGQLLRTFYPGSFTAGYNFGSSVAINGNKIVVGAPGANGGFFGTGAVYVFDATTGAKTNTLLPSVGTQRLGESMDIAGNQILVGSPSSSGGAAYLFDLQTGQQLRKFTSPFPNNTDSFGNSVTFDGARALIGSPHESVDGFFRVGGAYLFDTQNGALLASLLPDELRMTTSSFGVATAMSGNTLITGMVSDNNNSDNVYLVTIPEPATVGLLIVVGAAVSLRRRRMH